MSKIYLVGLPLQRYGQPMLGIGYVGAAVLKHGHEVKVHDVASENPGSLPQIEKEIREFKPDFVGISALTPQYLQAVGVFRLAKKIDGKIVTVFGGPHPSSIPEYVLNHVKEIDYCFVGEAEESFPKFINLNISGKLSSEKNAIPGLAYRENDRVTVNKPQSIKDLSTLDIPWKLLNPLSYNKGELQGYTCRHRPVITLMSSRGCPYKCTYCAQMSVFHYDFRARNSVEFVDEIEYLNKNFGVREIQLADDNFTYYRDHAEKFCNEILRRKLNISWALINGVRIDKVDEELFRLMKKAGCYYMAFGLEFGSPRILKLCKKGLSQENLQKGYENVRIAARMGFITHGFFLMGYPQETMEDIEMTRKLIFSLPLDRISLGMPVPYPGAELFDYYMEKRFKSLENIDWNEFIEGNFKPIWENLKGDDVIIKINETYRKFYMNPVRILKFISKFRTLEQFKATYQGFTKGLLNILKVVGTQK